MIRAPVYGWPSKYWSACSSPAPMLVSASPRPALPAAIDACTTSWWSVGRNTGMGNVLNTDHSEPVVASLGDELREELARDLTLGPVLAQGGCVDDFPDREGSVHAGTAVDQQHHVRTVPIPFDLVGGPVQAAGGEHQRRDGEHCRSHEARGRSIPRAGPPPPARSRKTGSPMPAAAAGATPPAGAGQAPSRAPRRASPRAGSPVPLHVTARPAQVAQAFQARAGVGSSFIASVEHASRIPRRTPRWASVPARNAGARRRSAQGHAGTPRDPRWR